MRQETRMEGFIFNLVNHLEVVVTFMVTQIKV